MPGAAPCQALYSVGLRGRLSDLLLAQPLTCGNLSGSILSQSRHLSAVGDRPSGPKSRSIGFPHFGQGLRSKVDTSSILKTLVRSRRAPVYSKAASWRQPVNLRCRTPLAFPRIRCAAGNRQAVITEVYGELVLVTDARCDGRFAKSIILNGADQTVYLVVDSVGVAGGMYRETEIERADLETVISDLLTGQFNAPVRIVAFNTLKHWAQDVSQEVAEGIQTRCDIEGEPVPEHVRDFVESHRGTARQLALRFGS
jgi:hypothetical protein